MQNIQRNNEQVLTSNRNWSVGQSGRMVMPKTLTIHFSRMVPLVVGVFVLVSLVSSDWAVQAATTARPVLNLQLTGPQTAQVKQTPQVGLTTKVGQPLVGINATLINPGPATQNARLRLIVHDGFDRDLKAGDIKIDVQEGSSWVSLPLEPIDGGVMGAIGIDGSGHSQRHQSGGFAIPANLNKLWPLRITFLLPGVYQLVMTVSPDNGSTHLATPSVTTLEAQ